LEGAVEYALNTSIQERERTMPQLRKLAPEEVQAIENKGKGTRKITEEQYDTFLSDYQVGDYGEAELEQDEKRLTVRNRLKAAASRREIGVAFRRTQGNIIRFQIITPTNGNGASKKSTASAVPAKRKGGRPKKAK
jgi:hypothetical protein